MSKRFTFENPWLSYYIKTVKELLPVHDAQILTYMKLLKIPQGLLFNFYTDKMSKSMKQFVNKYFSMFPD